MNVGMNCTSPVCDDYAGRGVFAFTGTIERVTFNFGDAPQPSGMQRLRLSARMD